MNTSINCIQWLTTCTSGLAAGIVTSWNERMNLIYSQKNLIWLGMSLVAHNWYPGMSGEKLNEWWEFFTQQQSLMYIHHHIWQQSTARRQPLSWLSPTEPAPSTFEVQTSFLHTIFQCCSEAVQDGLVNDHHNCGLGECIIYTQNRYNITECSRIESGIFDETLLQLVGKEMNLYNWKLTGREGTMFTMFVWIQLGIIDFPPTSWRYTSANLQWMVCWFISREYFAMCSGMFFKLCLRFFSFLNIVSYIIWVNWDLD